jgi:hypothetical protein
VLEMNQDQTVISLFSAPSADDPSRQTNPERAMAILCIFIFYRVVYVAVFYTRATRLKWGLF